MGAMIGDVLPADRMLRLDHELPVNAQQRQIIRNGKAAVIEQDMVIGTQTQQIVQRIRAVVGRS